MFTRSTILIALLALLLSACGTPNTPTAEAPASATDTSTTTAPAASGRELRIAENQFPASLDGDTGFAGYNLMAYGIAETLTRITPDFKVEPWLAESVEAIDDRRWRVVLREGVTFSDGSPVDAAAVKASLERSMSKQPGAVAVLLPSGTTLNADGRTLEIVTPEPVGALMKQLASYQLAIKKETSDGTILYTGPYIPSNFVDKTSLTLTAYSGYHGGPARSKTIQIRFIPDVNTRVLALQSGEVDMAHALLPTHIEQIKAAQLEAQSYPVARQNVIILNVQRAPLNDVKVRQALAVAIDRDSLISNVLNGIGTPAYALFPDKIGMAAVTNTQRFDRDAAARMLDEAGWKTGPDGVRVKDGQPLTFKLGFYTQRAEMEPFATIIKDQLKAIGVDVQLEQHADIDKTISDNAFDATLYSYGVAPYADPHHALSSLYTPASRNNDRYANPRVNELLKQYSQTTDQAKREELFREMQTLIGEDVPVIYINNTQQVTGMAAELRGFVPHPLENYRINPMLEIVE